jgi:hypothetical protein
MGSSPLREKTEQAVSSFWESRATYDVRLSRMFFIIVCTGQTAHLAELASSERQNSVPWKKFRLGIFLGSKPMNLVAASPTPRRGGLSWPVGTPAK